MSAIGSWASAHPVETLLLVSLVVGALGDVGRILEPSSPRVAAVFRVLSSLGVSLLGVARGIAPRAPEPPPPPPPTSRDERGATAVDVMGTIAAAGAAGLIAYALSGCGAAAVTEEAARYGAALEGCLRTAQTCEQYVRCRDEVQRSYGRGAYTATCKPSDAGPDAQVVDARADALEADAAGEGGAQ